MRYWTCGRGFDPRGFQVVVPGLGLGFDRVDCALEAGATGVPLVATPPPLPIAARPAALAVPAAAVPTSPPDDRAPGPTLPGPGLPHSGSSDPTSSSRPGS